jgi:hypothetical protein
LNTLVGNFIGTYGSYLSSFILPSNSWIKLISDGSNWICKDVSKYGWSYYQPITSDFWIYGDPNYPNNSIQSNPIQWYKSYFVIANSNNVNIYLTPVSSFFEELSSYINIISNNTYACIIDASFNAPLYVKNIMYPILTNIQLSSNVILSTFKTGYKSNGTIMTYNNNNSTDLVYINIISGSLCIGQTINTFDQENNQINVYIFSMAYYTSITLQTAINTTGSSYIAKIVDINGSRYFPNNKIYFNYNENDYFGISYDGYDLFTIYNMNDKSLVDVTNWGNIIGTNLLTGIGLSGMYCLSTDFVNYIACDQLNAVFSTQDDFYSWKIIEV